MAEVCDKEVNELLDKKAIIEIFNSGMDGFVCSLFVIPEKSGGFWPIVNLKPLNRFIRMNTLRWKILILPVSF
jgi:hypothetical protein